MKIAKLAALAMAAAVKLLRHALFGLAIAAGVALVKMVALGESLTQGMQQSLAIMGPVTAKMRKLMRETAIEVARTTITSARQAADAYFFLASAGLNAAQALAALPVVAKFAQAGMFDMATATDLLTDAQSALGLTVQDAEQNMKNMARVGDVLVKANTLANASVRQFSEALTTKAAAAMKMYGISVEEGVAVLAAFADQGIKGAQAGTAFQIVLRDLQTKTIQNTKAFEEQGIAVFTSTGAMRSFGDIFKDFESNMDGMSAKMKKTTLLQLGFTDKSIAFSQALVGASENMRQWTAGLFKAGDAINIVSNKQLTPFMKSWEQFKAALVTAASAFKPLIFLVQVAMDFFSAWVGIIKDVITALVNLNQKLADVVDDFLRGGMTEELREADERLAALDKKLEQSNIAKKDRELAAIKEIRAAEERSAKLKAGRDAGLAVKKAANNELALQRANIEFSLRTPTQVFDQEMARLNKIFDGGKKNAEVFGMAVARLRDEFTKSSKAGKEATRLQSLRVDVLERIKTPMARFLESMNDLSDLFVAGLLSESQLGLAAKQLKESLLPTAEPAGGGVERAGSRIISNLRDVIPGGGGGKKQSVFDEEAKRQREQSLIELRNISRSIASGGRLTVPAGT